MSTRGLARSGSARAAGAARGSGATAAGFGVAAVFWTTLSTILGAILFLRMGYAVGHLGLVGCLLLIVLGHLVTIPAALAVAEIATNQKVAGGGVYYVLSRSFGVTIGGSIGIALYLSQAISLAFYTIAFAEAFRPLLAEGALGWPLLPADARLVSVPAIGVLWAVLRLRGAQLGPSALYLVAGTLLVSLALFFAGDGEVIVPENGAERRRIINEWLRDADLTMVGMRREAVRRIGVDAFDGYDEIGNIAFVIGVSDVEIGRDEQVEEPPADADESASEGDLLKSAIGLAGA